MSVKNFFVISDRTAVNGPTLWQQLFNFGIAAMLFLVFSYFFFFDVAYDFSGIWKYRKLFIQGWITTVWISAASLALSFLIGLIAALCRRSRLLVLRYLALIYIELIRGTPLLVQILFFFYVVAYAAGIENRFLVGILTLSLFSGAYIAEMIRAGIESISQSQLDSARAIGLNRLQTYRFVIFPQAFRQVLPPLAGQFASLIKDSSLLSIIGIAEFTNNAQQVNSATYSTLESFLPLAVGYLILTLPISMFSKYLEERYHYAT